MPKEIIFLKRFLIARPAMECACEHCGNLLYVGAWAQENNCYEHIFCSKECACNFFGTEE